MFIDIFRKRESGVIQIIFLISVMRKQRQIHIFIMEKAGQQNYINKLMNVDNEYEVS